jgi:two-component system, NtrC family, sensor kinase
MKSTIFIKTVLTPTGFRIFLGLAAGMILSAIVINFVFFKLQEQRLDEHVALSGRSLAKLFASHVQLGVFANSPELLELPVASLLGHPDILAVTIYDAAGQPIVDRVTNHPVPLTTGNTALEAWPVNDRDISSSADAPALIFKAPVLTRVSATPEDDLFFDGTGQGVVKEIGWVKIRMSARQLIAGRNEFIVQSLLVGIVFLIVILPLTFYIVTASSRPLRQLLLRVKQQMGESGPPSGDIALLDSTFSSLFDELDHSFQTINSLREGLEQKVEQRTTELRTSNTQLAQTLNELKQAHMQLVHSEKMASLGLLATGLAHEINNGLTLIRGSLFPLEKVTKQLVGNQPATNQEHRQNAQLLAELIKHMTTGVQRITSLIKDLMTFARPGKGTRHLVDLNLELEMTLRLLNVKARGGVKIEVLKDFSPLQPVCCHGSQIAQVFLNIILNAIQAIDQEGHIHLTTAMAGDSVCITIEDNGCGIAPDDLPKIFDPFFTTKEVGQGTGLGLGICYAIIHEHQGEIRVTSRLGTGTKFTIILPVFAVIGRCRNFQDPSADPTLCN